MMIMKLRPRAARHACSLVAFALLAGGCARSTEKNATEHRATAHEAHGDNQTHGKDKAGVVELSPESFKRAGLHMAAAKLRDLPTVLDTTGEVAFDQDHVAHVSPRIPGRVHRVHAKLGDTVKAGQSLAIIDSIELGRAKAAYLQARAQLALSQKNLSREEGLLKERISSAKDVLAARAVHQKAMADYRAARQRLRLVGVSSKAIDRLRYDKSGAALVAVRSPIAGRITKKHLTLGELVRPSSNLFTVADLSRVWVWVDVYERDLAGVHLKDKVAVRVEAYPKRVFSGEVAYISDQVDRRTRAVRARLDVENKDGALKPGMFARVRLTDPHTEGGIATRRQAVAVPASAVQRQGKEQIVFVRIGKRRFVRRAVRVGTEAGNYVEIRSGVKAGEVVVKRGAFILKSELSKGSMGEGHSH